MYIRLVCMYILYSSERYVKLDTCTAFINIVGKVDSYILSYVCTVLAPLHVHTDIQYCMC